MAYDDPTAVDFTTTDHAYDAASPQVAYLEDLVANYNSGGATSPENFLESMYL